MAPSSPNTPFFSIILPVFNREGILGDTIGSVLDQTFTSWELIAIDDGSTDNSAGVIQEFCRSDSRIKLLQQPNQKQAVARNTGIKTAKGKWIAFIDSDDLWLPRKLQLQYEYIQQNSNVDVVFTDGYTQFQGKKIRYYYHHDIALGLFSGHQLYKKMLFGNLIPILSLVIKSEWIHRIGEQDETVSGVEDHDYCLRLCRAGATFYGMKERLFVYHVHDNNFSANMVNQHFISSSIRIKNYDEALLNKEDIKNFVRLFTWYSDYFKEQGKPEWARYTTQKFKSLKVTPLSVRERLNDRLYIVKNNLKDILKDIVLFFLQILYFYPRKHYDTYKSRVHTLYTKYLNSKNIGKSAYVRLSSNADIVFYNRDGSYLDVRGLYMGEFSRINFIAENASVIAGAHVVISKFCNFNILGQLILGNNVLFNNNCMITCRKEITIGDDTWFGEGVKLYDHTHNYRERTIPFTAQGLTDGSIKIGNNVWVGSNTVILSNVSIGDGCVIGANNVIYKSVPPNTVVKSMSMDLMDPIV